MVLQPYEIILREERESVNCQMRNQYARTSHGKPVLIHFDQN